jgi:DNA-binding response OmpR family regulator
MKSKYKIVLVEDDELLGSTIVELLQVKNFEVEWFKDGLQALHYFKKNSCDIIISDLIMPNIDGEQLFLKLHQLLKNNSIPFIIITANVDQNTKHRQLSHGVNDYITKPFKINELLYKINNILDFKFNIIQQFRPDPLSKVNIKLSEKNFLIKVDEILLKHIKKHLNHKELAELLFISKSTLDKRIRAKTGKNTSKYIREFKLNFAIKMISGGEQNVQYLAEETGFNSLSYFSTSFKAYMKISPISYIKLQEIKSTKI